MNFESWNRLAISLCKDFKALQPERIVSNYNSSILDTRYALFHTSLQCFCEEGATCMKLKRTVVVQGIQKLEICWGFKPWKQPLTCAHSLLHPWPQHWEVWWGRSWSLCGQLLSTQKPVRGLRESVTVGTGPPLHPPASQNHGDNTSSCEWGRVGVQAAAFFDLGSVYSMTRNIMVGDHDYGIRMNHTKLPAFHHSDVR